jgi:antitoxin (DNA-binding transcriptional repressor) of toxin-antitoxin stability system
VPIRRFHSTSSPEGPPNLKVEQGGEVVISRAGKPVAKVVPLSTSVQRTGRGSLKGTLVLADDWDSAETNAAIAADFGMGS